MTEPYVKREPGDFIFSEDWNDLQKQAKEHIQTHSHSGGGQGTKITGTGIDPNANVTLKNLVVTGDLQVQGKQALAQISDLLATLMGLGGGAVGGTAGGLSLVLGQLASAVCDDNDADRRQAFPGKPVDGESSLLRTTLGMVINIVRIMYAVLLEVADVGDVGEIDSGVTLGTSGSLNMAAFLKAASYPAFRMRLAEQGALILSQLNTYGVAVPTFALAETVGRRLLAADEPAPQDDTTEAAVAEFKTRVDAFYDDFGDPVTWNGVSARQALLDRFYRPLVGSDNLDHAATAKVRDLILECLAATWRHIAHDLLVLSPPQFDLPPGIDAAWTANLQERLRIFERAIRGDGLVRDLAVPITDLQVEADPSGGTGWVWVVSHGAVMRMPCEQIVQALVDSSLQENRVVPVPNLTLRPAEGWELVDTRVLERSLLLLMRGLSPGSSHVAIGIATRFLGPEPYLLGELTIAPDLSGAAPSLSLINEAKGITVSVPSQDLLIDDLTRPDTQINSTFVKGEPSDPPLFLTCELESIADPGSYDPATGMNSATAAMSKRYYLHSLGHPGQNIVLGDLNPLLSVDLQAFLAHLAGNNGDAETRLLVYTLGTPQQGGGQLQISDVLADDDPVGGDGLTWHATYQFPSDVGVIGLAKEHLLLNKFATTGWMHLPLAALLSDPAAPLPDEFAGLLTLVADATDPMKFTVQITSEDRWNQGQIMDFFVAHGTSWMSISNEHTEWLELHHAGKTFDLKPIRGCQVGATQISEQTALHQVNAASGVSTLLVVSARGSLIEFNLVTIPAT